MMMNSLRKENLHKCRQREYKRERRELQSLHSSLRPAGEIVTEQRCLNSGCGLLYAWIVEELNCTITYRTPNWNDWWFFFLSEKNNMKVAGAIYKLCGCCFACNTSSGIPPTWHEQERTADDGSLGCTKRRDDDVLEMRLRGLNR